MHLFKIIVILTILLNIFRKEICDHAIMIEKMSTTLRNLILDIFIFDQCFVDIKYTKFSRKCDFFLREMFCFFFL